LRKIKNICLFCVISIITGCTNTAQDTTVQPLVRAALKSSGSGSIKAQVFVEGSDGNALSGAVVIVKEDNNSLLQLLYETSTCSYSGVLEEKTGRTNYIIEAASILSGGIISLKVPYTKLAAAPNVTIFQDADGNSVLKGQHLSGRQSIQIGWDDCGENVVYVLIIRTSLKTIYTVTSNACTVTVPPDTIPAGAYLLEISAQKIHGDVYFRSFPYYSVSSINAPLMSCYVN
jgi:hypothetical protein